MPIDFKALENKVYAKLDENDGKGLQPDDAQDLVDTVAEDRMSERMQKLLEQLAETKPNRMDRMRITTSLLQLFEAHRQDVHEDQDEQGVVEELFSLAERAGPSGDNGTNVIGEGVEIVQGADEAVFDDADITREDAAQFLRDVQAEIEEFNDPKSIVANTLKSVGEALKQG